MAGVLGQLIKPQKQPVEHRSSWVDPVALELQTAKEILAEVFHARPGEVEEMIRSRLEEGGCEVGRWSATFCLGGRPSCESYMNNSDTLI